MKLNSGISMMWGEGGRKGGRGGEGRENQTTIHGVCVDIFGNHVTHIYVLYLPPAMLAILNFLMKRRTRYIIYLHLKLQRSVSDILRYLWRLPNLSVRKSESGLSSSSLKYFLGLEGRTCLTGNSDLWRLEIIINSVRQSIPVVPISPGNWRAAQPM